ncbi:MAG: hypothetical protein GKS05_06630 [Nitrospirales bacterium]|nr:hypothetical protein [Nitrospirales bacterium]
MNNTSIQKTSKLQTINQARFGGMHSCVRCQGLLVKEYFLDMQQDDSIWGAGWRCVNCGAITASVLQQTRQHRAIQTDVSKLKQRKKYLSVSQQFVSRETHA